jgi:hypothetical protein
MASLPTGKPDATPAAPAADQQHTGNHDRPKREKDGNEKLGGTRAGAENVEPRK